MDEEPTSASQVAPKLERKKNEKQTKMPMIRTSQRVLSELAGGKKRGRRSRTRTDTPYRRPNQNRQKRHHHIVCRWIFISLRDKRTAGKGTPTTFSDHAAYSRTRREMRPVRRILHSSRCGRGPKEKRQRRDNETNETDSVERKDFLLHVLILLGHLGSSTHNTFRNARNRRRALRGQAWAYIHHNTGRCLSCLSFSRVEDEVYRHRDEDEGRIAL